MVCDKTKAGGSGSPVTFSMEWKLLSEVLLRFHSYCLPFSLGRGLEWRYDVCRLNSKHNLLNECSERVFCSSLERGELICEKIGSYSLRTTHREIILFEESDEGFMNNFLEDKRTVIGAFAFFSWTLIDLSHF